MMKKLLTFAIAIIMIAISIASASAGQYYTNPYVQSNMAQYHGSSTQGWGTANARPFPTYQNYEPRYIPGPNSVFTQPRNSYNPVGYGASVQTIQPRNSYNPITYGRTTTTQSYGPSYTYNQGRSSFGFNVHLEDWGNSFGGYGQPDWNTYQRPSSGNFLNGGAGFSLFGVTAGIGNPASASAPARTYYI